MLTASGAEAAATRGLRKPKAGGYSTIKNIGSDEDAQAAAMFARYDLGSATQDYSFVNSITITDTGVAFSGKQQVVAGMNYDLKIAVMNDKQQCQGAFQATVYQDLNGGMEVTTWGDEVSCPTGPLMPGGWAPIQDIATDAGAQSAAEFARYDLGSSSQSYSFTDSLTMADTGVAFSGFEQVVAGTNYQINIGILDDSGTCQGAFQATVYADLSGSMQVTQWGPELPCPEESVVVGGWSPIPDIVDDNQAQAAARFSRMKLGQSTVSYSFANDINGGDQGIAMSGFQQLVAGTNYRLNVKLLDTSSQACVGAYEATVYQALNGNMEVTEWGPELPCQ